MDTEPKENPQVVKRHPPLHHPRCQFQIWPCSSRFARPVANIEKKMTEAPISTPPQAYMDIIGPMIDKARRVLEAGEKLQPMAFVGNLTTKQVVPVTVQTGSEACVVGRTTADQAQGHFQKETDYWNNRVPLFHGS